MSEDQDKQQRSMLVLGAVALALAPIAVYAPLGTAVLLILTLAAQPCWERTMAALRWWSTRSRLVFIGTLLALWATVTLFWSPVGRPLALPSVAIVPVIGLLLLAAVRQLKVPAAAGVARLAMYGGLLMLALLALEVFSKGAVLRFVVPASPANLAFDQTPSVVEAAARGIAVLAPLSFVYATLIYIRTGKVLLSAAFVAAVLAVGTSTSMDAGWAAVAVGIVAFAVGLKAPRVALGGLFAGLMIYAALAPVIHGQLITLELVHDFSTRALLGTETRIGIWQYASQLIAAKPILGYGFDATRELAKMAPMIPGTSYPALPLHTHNGFLQIWLELGVVGIGVVIVFMAFALRALWPLTKTPIYLAIAIATITTTMLFFLVSFGVWQHWWIATWFLVAGQLFLALRVLARTRFTPV